MKVPKKLILIFALAIVIPLVPFLWLGEDFERQLQAMLQDGLTPGTVFLLTAASLAIDIFLPVPSSAISTYAGSQLGIVAATLATFLGMTLGGLVGFGLARWFGEPLLNRFTSPEERETLALFRERYGIWTIVVTRPLPLVAEPCIFVLAAMQMPLRQFLPPFLLSNLLVAMIYSTAGYVFGSEKYLAWTLVASVVIPTALAYLVKKQLTGASKRGFDSPSER